MIPTEIPSRPWKTLSADLFYVQQSWFLIVVDYYSKFPFVKKLQNLTSGAVVNEMKMLFAENGIPESLQCGNGTQFISGEFHQLASQYGFEIVTSSLHYPRGHGFVERQVQTVKKTILKCRETKEDRSSPAGSTFISGEFHQLASQYGFEIVTSSPHYPRGHGLVERQVQTVKKTILKCRETKEDRSSPAGSTDNAPEFQNTVPSRWPSIQIHTS